jgi:hypothetical protein
MRWLKCSLKLIGRGAIFAFAVWAAYWIMYAFWIIVFNFVDACIGTLIAVLIGVAIVIISATIAFVCEMIGKYVKWSCSPPLLEPKGEK